MPHSPELIQKILQLVEGDYPPSDYDYVIEKMIPGTRMFPDIAISCRATRKICCVIEIGYTRPEKLAAYRMQMKIPDVRWYDKKGNLHTKELDVVSKRVVLEPGGDFSAYIIHDLVECFSDICEEDVGDADDEEAFLYRQSSVKTVLITDWHYAWFPSFCDKCGEHFLPSCHEEAITLTSDLESLSPNRFGITHGRRALYAGWSDVVRFAKENLFWHSEISIEYMDGIPLGDAPNLRRASAVFADQDRRQWGR